MVNSSPQTPVAASGSSSESNENVEDVHPHLTQTSSDTFDYDSMEYSPYKVTLDMYKARCSELETRLVNEHVANTTKNLEIETLKTKVDLLTEYYQSLDLENEDANEVNNGVLKSQNKENMELSSNKQVLAPAPSPPPTSVICLALKCAELEAELNSKQPREAPKTVLHSTHTVNNTSENGEFQQKASQQQRIAGPVELLALLKSACRQLEEARRVGSQLRVKLAHQRNRPLY